MARPRLDSLLVLVLAALLVAASVNGRPINGEPGNGMDRRLSSIAGGHSDGGRGGRHSRQGDKLFLSPNSVLAAASEACRVAANSTSDLTAACTLVDSGNLTTRADREARKALECSNACTDAVEAYWSALESACGDEPLLEIHPRNSSLARSNVTAADLGPAALLNHALGCAKDASGSYCPRGYGGRSSDHGHKLEARHRGGRPGGDRGHRNNETESRLPKTHLGTKKAHGTRLPHTESHSHKSRATRGARATREAGDLHKRDDKKRPSSGPVSRPGKQGTRLANTVSGSKRHHHSGTPLAHTKSHSLKSHATRGPRPTDHVAGLHPRDNKRPGPPGALKSIRSRGSAARTVKSAHTQSHSRKVEATRLHVSGTAKPTRPTGSSRPKGKRDEGFDSGRPQFNATICEEVGPGGYQGLSMTIADSLLVCPVCHRRPRHHHHLCRKLPGPDLFRKILRRSCLVGRS